LERSDPPNNAFLSESPHQVRMWFSESVAVQLSAAYLLDINGQKIEGVRLMPDPTNRRLVTAELPLLEKGLYSLNWQVLSAADGHRTEGLLVFGVKLAPGGSLGAVAPSANGPDWLQALARGVTDVAVCGLFGVLIITLGLLFQTGADDYRQARGRARVWALGLAALAFLAGFAQFALLPGAITSPGTLLSSTQWGQAWLVRQALLALLCFAFLALRPLYAQESSRGLWAGTAAGAGLVLATLSYGAHTAFPASPALSLLTNLLHLLAAGLWVGGLIGLVFITRPFARGGLAGDGMARSVWAGFGRFAVLAVSVTIATGLLSASGLVLSSNGLTGSPYGLFLASKVGLVLLVGLGGLLNSLTLHPALARPIANALRRPSDHPLFSLRQLPLRISLEACLGLGVLILAGTLASTPPPNGIAYRYASVEQLPSVSAQQSDLILTMTIQPNQPGPNIIDLRVSSIRRPAPAEITRVILRMTYEGEAMGTQSADAILVSPNVYRLGGESLSLPGPWKLEVVVRRQGVSDVVFPLEWKVLPIGYQPGNYALQPWLLGASAFFFVLALVAFGWVVTARVREKKTRH
jgi:copper transport protein